MINFFFVKNLGGLTPLIKTWTPPKEVKTTGWRGLKHVSSLPVISITIHFPYSCLEETFYTISGTPKRDGAIS